jgi:hypothetical protein
MVSLAFAIAASANFPVLFMSVLWKDCTTKGAVIGGFLGLISSVALTVVSPSVWEATLGNPKGSALFPYTSPALFSMTIGFVGIWLFSITGQAAPAAKDRAAFPAQQVRSETGLGAALRATDRAITQHRSGHRALHAGADPGRRACRSLTKASAAITAQIDRRRRCRAAAVGRQLLELVVVIQRRDFDAGCGRPMPSSGHSARLSMATSNSR